MATVEQPLKKQKFPDQLLSPLSQEEILKKRRNRDDIRSLYGSYRRIRFCVSQKDSRLMPDFEQAYLSLITASRGCTSVQRIVAELIPRYASFCPTALEAAAQVSINMYSWSLNTVMKGEDIDGVAYQTAKACISGLVEICSAASQQKLTSSVISGICSAVFQTVINFFVSTFENKDIYTIGYSQIEKLQEPIETFSDMNQEMVDDKTPLLNLFKFRVLCLFRIFMCYPRNIIDACFEILVANKTDVSLGKGVEYFLKQLTSQFDANKVIHSSDKISDGITKCAESAQGNTDCKGSDGMNLVPNEIKDHEGPFLSKNSFIEMAFHDEPSLRCWMLSSYKKLCESFKPEDLSVISVFLEKIFGSLSDAVKEITSLEINNKPLDSGDKCPIPSQNSNALNMEDVDTTKTKDSHILNLNKPLLSCNVDSQSSLGTLNLAAVTKPSLSGLNDPSVPARTSIFNSVHSTYQSPSQQSSYSKKKSYCDGDPASMDVFLASNQLWIGSLGHNASESSVRAQFEDFGSLILYIFLPAKGFALVEYKNLFDAVRARNYMQGSSVWGGRLCIKFLVSGFGSKGTINNLAIGDNCHVYVGKVMSPRENDGILHILKMAGIRKPHMYDLSIENALLMKFASAEEASNAMAHIRHFRCNSTGSHIYPSGYSSGYYTTVMEITPPNPYSNSFAYKPEGGSHELVSPRLQMLDVRPSNFCDYGRSMLHDQPYAGHMTHHSTQPWIPSMLPPQIQTPQPIHPIYYTPSNAWDNFSPNASMTHPDNHLFTPRPTVPFIPASITPVSQLSVNPVANAPAVAPPPPPNGPPHSPSPPPPPPTSPPPEGVPQPYKEPLVHFQWEGTLSKSGVRYCKMYATREDLSASKYLNDLSEPSDWPASLDVTKRTDIRHVKTTFANTRPHRREVCRLLPSTPSDHKGLQDFISYLKQRECAGVIKIPSGAFLWARLLFIVPPSPETCSLLGISPHPTDCLLAVVLPKDANNEGA